MENFPKEESKGFVRDTMRKLSIHMPRSEASFQSKLAQYEIEIKDLQERIRVVEHDSESLIRHLEKTISHYEALKRKYHQSLEQLTQGKKQNEKLVGALQEAKEQITRLNGELEQRVIQRTAQLTAANEELRAVIAERTRAEAALQEAQAKLARAERVTAMGEMAGAIAHETNQPLAAIITEGESCLRWLARSPPNLTSPIRPSVAQFSQVK